VLINFPDVFTGHSDYDRSIKKRVLKHFLLQTINKYLSPGAAHALISVVGMYSFDPTAFARETHKRRMQIILPATDNLNVSKS